MQRVTCDWCGGTGRLAGSIAAARCGKCDGDGTLPVRAGDVLVPPTRGADLNLPLTRKVKTAAELRKELAEAEAREVAEWSACLPDCPEDLLRAECKRRGWTVSNPRSP